MRQPLYLTLLVMAALGFLFNTMTASIDGQTVSGRQFGAIVLIVLLTLVHIEWLRDTKRILEARGVNRPIGPSRTIAIMGANLVLLALGFSSVQLALVGLGFFCIAIVCWVIE